MEFKRLENSDSLEFKIAWKIYKQSFPADERRTLELQKKLFKNDKYSFFIVIKDHNIVAIATEWQFSDFLFGEHLAVEENLRGKGIGIELLKSYILKNNRKIVLEVEMPVDEIAINRIRFYEKAGFSFVEEHYRILPSQSFWRILYHKKFPGVPLIDKEYVLVFKK